jgi:hypothetical protein
VLGVGAERRRRVVELARAPRQGPRLRHGRLSRDLHAHKEDEIRVVSCR